MAERVYEGMFLLDANRYSRDSAGVSTRITDMIEKCGGTVLVSRLWAEQKLAYQIQRHRKGAYWLTYFRMDPSRLSELNRAGQLNNDVMRALFIVVDPRLVETLVAHAGGTDRADKPAAETPSETSATTTESKEPEAAAAE